MSNNRASEGNFVHFVDVWSKPLVFLNGKSAHRQSHGLTNALFLARAPPKSIRKYIASAEGASVGKFWVFREFETCKVAPKSGLKLLNLTKLGGNSAPKGLRLWHT